MTRRGADRFERPSSLDNEADRGPLGRPAPGPPTATPTVRIAARDRRPATLGILIAAFLAIAILKPWPGPAGSGSIEPDPVVAPSAGRPSSGPDLLTGLREHCQEPLGWRVYSREAWNDHALRAWRSVEPAMAAIRPLDPDLPTVQLGPGIAALGYCSPWTGAERPTDDTVVSAWRIVPDRRGGRSAEGLRLASIAPDRPTPLGALYGPIAARFDPSLPEVPGWAAGRYVFAVRAAAWERWWAVEIAEPDRRPGSVSPDPSATL